MTATIHPGRDRIYAVCLGGRTVTETNSWIAAEEIARLANREASRSRQEAEDALNDERAAA